jgi:antitoxin VapB
MSINIKNKEAERLLAEIKQATGKGASAVILELLKAERERLVEVKRERTERKWAALREIQERVKANAPPDAPTYEQIMEEMYDEKGLPR